MHLSSTMCALHDIWLNTPTGVLNVSCCEKGVHSIHIKNCVDNEQNSKDFKELKNCKVDENSTVKNAVVWLKNYFEAPGKISEDMPTICPTVFSSKGKFTGNVWKTLFMNVPFGTTISYAGLAELCGSPSASRAVGTAMKNNPIPILIPCHRVIKSDGSIGRYSGGNGVKEWLLKHENVLL